MAGMAGTSSKLNVNNVSIVSLGHVDTDSYIDAENSFKRRTAKEVKITSQSSEVSIPIDQEQKNHKQDEEHVKAFNTIFNTFFKFASVLGIVLSYNWKFTTHKRFFFTFFLLTFAWVCIFYTQGMHINNGDTLRVLEACGIYGTGSSSVQKFLGYIKHRDEIICLFCTIRKICLQTSSRSRGDILTSNLIKTIAFLKLFALGVTLCVGVFLVCSLKAYFVDNELVPLLPIEILFVDQSNNSGFILANCIMIVMGAYSALGIILYGAAFIFAIFMYSLMVDLMEQDLKDLDAMWADKNTISIAYKHAFLRNICKKRQDLNDYMYAIKGIFETKLFYYFTFSYFSQIICLFEIAYSQWTPGYGIALVSFIEMMFYCYMGTKITIADERLFDAICATNWYTYDMYSQKIIILLLHQSEEPNELQLGPIGPLNMITGITVVKSIYSYYTIMTELL